MVNRTHFIGFRGGLNEIILKKKIVTVKYTKHSVNITYFSLLLYTFMYV